MSLQIWVLISSAHWRTQQLRQRTALIISTPAMASFACQGLLHRPSKRYTSKVWTTTTMQLVNQAQNPTGPETTISSLVGLPRGVVFTPAGCTCHLVGTGAKQQRSRDPQRGIATKKDQGSFPAKPRPGPWQWKTPLAPATQSSFDVLRSMPLLEGSDCSPIPALTTVRRASPGTG